MMFLGENRVQLDAKNRLRLPANYRREIGGLCYVTVGLNSCLQLFKADEFEDYVQKLQEIPAHDIESRRGVRTFMALAKEIEPDDQGRFILPKNLKDYAKIDKNVVFAGVGKSIEIWAEEEWDKYFDMSNLDSALAIIGEKYKV